jgi:hypothetical protein
VCLNSSKNGIQFKNMVETNLIITIIVVSIVVIGLAVFVVVTFATQSVFYTNNYVRPPLANAIQPNGPARNLTQAEINCRNIIINGGTCSNGGTGLAMYF